MISSQTIDNIAIENCVIDFEMLQTEGYCIVPGVLSKSHCESLRNMFDEEQRYRQTVNMSQYHFGKGKYRYFNDELPYLVSSLREHFYHRLVCLANQWSQNLSLNQSYPKAYDNFLKECEQFGQSKPTPLILRYRANDYNRLHQDIYGDISFPFQMVILLSQPKHEFVGGELILVEQQPRKQSIPRVVHVKQGEMAIIANRYIPRQSSRGYFRAQLRHGVSRIISGERFTLGIIFHNAR